jgi:excisionase family DNA binding protein
VALPTLYDVDEVAEFLKITPAAVRKMEERGQLRAIRLGKRRLRFREADLLEVIQRASSAKGADRV